MSVRSWPRSPSVHGLTAYRIQITGCGSISEWHCLIKQAFGTPWLTLRALEHPTHNSADSLWRSRLSPWCLFVIINKVGDSAVPSWAQTMAVLVSPQRVMLPRPAVCPDDGCTSQSSEGGAAPSRRVSRRWLQYVLRGWCCAAFTTLKARRETCSLLFGYQ